MFKFEVLLAPSLRYSSDHLCWEFSVTPLGSSPTEQTLGLGTAMSPDLAQASVLRPALPLGGLVGPTLTGEEVLEPGPQ